MVKPETGKALWKLLRDGAFASEVGAGRWWVQVRSPHHPEIVFGPKDLQPAEAWDLVERLRGAEPG